VPPNDPPVNNRLLALGTAAVIAVFGAGFVRTQQAAERIEGASRRRHSAAPIAAPSIVAEHNTVDSGVPATPEPPATSAASDAEQAIVVAAELTAKGKTEQATNSRTEQQAKVKTEPKPDTTTQLAEVAATKPAPVAPDTTSVKAPADSNSVARDLKDGIYTGWGTSRHGDIESRVEIRNGRIISASIAQCLTMYSVYWIAALPPQVVKRQSPEVDVISGATESSNAFYDGVVNALKKAK
jgi:uncharacterized protein with FMN-binding domain